MSQELRRLVEATLVLERDAELRLATIFDSVLNSSPFIDRPNFSAFADEPKPESETGSESEQRLKQTLEWLPFATETIIAAQGPFQVRASITNPDPPPKQKLSDMLESWSLTPLHSLRKGKYLKTLAGQNGLGRGAVKFAPTILRVGRRSVRNRRDGIVESGVELVTLR